MQEEAFAVARRTSARTILGAISAVILGGGKPANVRLVAAAIRITREFWATYFLPRDRARMIVLVSDPAKQAPDETARTDLAAFTTALQAVN